MKSVIWSSPDALLCLAPLIISFQMKFNENVFPRDALNVLQLVMVIWSTGSSCSGCEINVQGMVVSSSTITVSFSRSVLLWVVLSVNAALASLFYNAWPQDWILTGFLESTIPRSPSLYGFFVTSALWTWGYCKQEVCVWIVLLWIFKAHSSKEMSSLLVCSKNWKSFSLKKNSSYIHRQSTDKPVFTKYCSDPKASA